MADPAETSVPAAAWGEGRFDGETSVENRDSGVRRSEKDPGLDAMIESSLDDLDGPPSETQARLVDVSPPRRLAVPRPKDLEVEACVDEMRLDVQELSRAHATLRDTAKMQVADPALREARRTPDRPTTRMDVTSLLTRAAHRSDPPAHDQRVTQRMTAVQSGVYEVVPGRGEEPQLRRRETDVMWAVPAPATSPRSLASPSAETPDDERIGEELELPLAPAGELELPSSIVPMRPARRDSTEPFEKPVQPLRSAGRSAVLMQTVPARREIIVGDSKERSRPSDRAWLYVYALTTFAILAAIAALALR